MGNRGFTLIEIMIGVALVVILTGTYFLVANPAQQLGIARNTQRQLYLQTIMNAIRQNIADQTNEQFSCSSGPIPTSTPAKMTSQGGANTYNIAPCIVVESGGVAEYGLFTMPFDPATSTAYYNSLSDYNSGFTIIESASGSITLSAPAAELKQTISVTR